MSIHTRRRGDACLSDYELDALEVGVASVETTLRAEVHLPSCEGCARRRAEIRRFAHDFAIDLAGGLADRPALFADAMTELRKPILRGPKGPPSSTWRGIAGAFAFAVVAILALRVADPGSRPEREVESVRTKGAAAMGLFIERRGAMRRANEEETVFPGDRLQFIYRSPVPVHVIVLSLDGAERASVYFARAQALPATTANEEATLPTSVTLDGILGREEIWGIVCRKFYDGEMLRRRFAREGSALLPLEGCEVARWQLMKATAEP